MFLRGNQGEWAMFFPPFNHRKGKAGKAISVVGWISLVITAGGLFLQNAAAAEQDNFGSTNQAIQRYLQAQAAQLPQFAEATGLRVSHQTDLEPLKELAACHKLEISGGSSRVYGRQLLELKCFAPQQWSKTLVSEVDISLPVLVNTEVINRGQNVLLQQIEVKEMQSRDLNRGFYQNPDQVVGMGAKRRIRAGQVLHSALLEEPILVRRGDILNVVASNQQYSVSISARAAEDGALGDTIKLRNVSSNSLIEATIVEPGLAVTHR